MNDDAFEIGDAPLSPICFLPGRATVIMQEIAAQAQQLLAVGLSPREVAEELGLKPDTLRKAIRQGRLIRPCPQEPGEPIPENTPGPQQPAATDKSTRAALDAVAEMGTACTRPNERVLAAIGLLKGHRPALKPVVTSPLAACRVPCRP